MLCVTRRHLGILSVALIAARAFHLQKQEKQFGPSNHTLSIDLDGSLAGDGEHTQETETREHDDELKSEAASDGDHLGLCVAAGMFGTVIMLSMIFSMASTSNTLVNKNSWIVIDNVVAIFLAVMLYQATDDVLAYLAYNPHHEVLSAGVHAMVLFSVVLGVSWLLKSKPIVLSSLCGAGAHFIAFAAMHWTTTAVELYTEEFWEKILAFVMFCIIFVACSCVVHLTKKYGRLVHDEWNEAVTDMENDAIAMGLAVVWTMVVCFLLCGHEVDIEAPPNEVKHHRSLERCMLLTYATLLIPISALLIAFLPTLDHLNPDLMPRVRMFLVSFCSMASAWGFVVWGHWLFYDHYFHQAVLFGRIVFAISASIIAGVGIVTVSKFAHAGDTEFRQNETKMTLVALSLVVGWSWEQCFDAAIEAIVEDFEHKTPYLKIILTAGLMLTVVPTYVVFLKPVVIEKNK